MRRVQATYYEDVIEKIIKDLNIKFLICDYKINNEAVIHISSKSIGLDLDTYSKDKGNLLVVSPFILTSQSICDIIPYIQQSLEYRYVNKAYLLFNTRLLGSKRFYRLLKDKNFSMSFISPLVKSKGNTGAENLVLLEFNTEGKTFELINLSEDLC